MKNNNRHLDDLFAAARHEEPILSQDNARDILSENKRMQSSSKLISTQGAIMTSIGLSAAAVTAFILLSGSPSANPPISSSSQPQTANLLTQPLSSHTVEPKKSDPLAAKKNAVDNDDEDDNSVPTPPTPPEPPQPPSSIPVPPVPPVPPTPPVLVTPPLKVAGITPVTITPEKYAKMGITKKTDGTVGFSQKNDKGDILTMSFPKSSWGVILDDDDASVSKADLPKFAPLIVTDTKGNKRMMQFTSEADGVKLKALQFNSHSDENGIDNALTIKGMTQIGGEDGIADRMVVGPGSDDKSQIHEINVQAESRVKSEDTDEDDPDDYDTTPQKQVKITVNTDRRETDTTINGKQHKMVFVKKIVVKDSSVHGHKGLNMDSILNQVGVKMKVAEKQMAIARKKMDMINMDSIFQAAGEAMKKAQEEIKHLNIDSIMHEADKSLKKADEEIKRMNFDSILKSANESMSRAEEMMAKRCNELNNLVPILVRAATKDHVSKDDGITYDDGLIFWYDNSDDLKKAVRDPSGPEPGSVQFTIDAPPPDSKAVPVSMQVNRADNIMSKTLIYPNPAKTIATIRFTIAEPRTLAFSIHDLLGKRVVDAGSISENAAGSYEKELNVNDLPAGVYLLVITTDKGEQNIQRLVIER